MKVSFVNLKPLSHRGGAEKWIYEVGRMIVEEGNEAEILIPSDENKVMDILGFKHIFYKSKFFIIMKRLNLLNFYPPLLIIPSNYNSEIFYVPTIHSLLLFKKVLKYKKKLIVGAHDLFIPNHIGIDLFQKFSYIGIYILSMKQAITIHSLNSLTSSKFRNLKANIVEIGNEFIALSAERDFESNHKNLSINKDNKFRVLFLGNIEPRKGSKLIPNLLRSFSSNDNIEFIIAGKIRDKKILKKLIDSPSNFVLMGEIDDQQKRFLFSNSDLFIFLSEREASPIVIEEAFSNGLPVVSTWKSIINLNSFNISNCTVCNRKVGNVKDSIIRNYRLWSLNPFKYNLEKKARSELYINTYSKINYKEKIINMILRS